MKNHLTTFTISKAPALLPLFAIICLLLSLGVPAPSRDLETVPGLTATGGIQRLGIDVPVKEYQDSSDAVAPPIGSLGFWTRLYGDATALQYLSKPGILPLEHEVYVSTWYGEVALKDLRIVGKLLIEQPEWRTGHLARLNWELNTKHQFFTSGLSRYEWGDGTQEYNIRFITAGKKWLAGADGRKIVIPVVVPR